MNDQNNSKISIITPSYNHACFIEQTILSVLNQGYANFEHIVIDGGSTDNTVEILTKYPHLIWVSEKDRGQADALNKGLGRATGDIIGWINSDDYYQEHIFSSVAGNLIDPATQWVVGNVANQFDDGDAPRFRKSQDVTRTALIGDPDIVRQQPTFFRREFLLRAGGWNAEFYMAMDFDLWMRLVRWSAPLMVDEDWAYYRNHAAQKSSHANILRQMREISAILRREQVSWSQIAPHQCKKRWYWFKGLLKARLASAGLVPGKYRNRPVRIGAK